MSTITERVAAGAAFLDERDPEWWREIDLDALELDDPSACVLGQRCPAERRDRYLLARWGQRADEVWDADNFKFWALAYQYSGVPDDAEGDREGEVAAWFNAMGFNSAEGDADEYATLTAEWTRVITERRAS